MPSQGGAGSGPSPRSAAALSSRTNAEAAQRDLNRPGRDRHRGGERHGGHARAIHSHNFFPNFGDMGGRAARAAGNAICRHPGLFAPACALICLSAPRAGLFEAPRSAGQSARCTVLFLRRPAQTRRVCRCRACGGDCASWTCRASDVPASCQGLSYRPSPRLRPHAPAACRRAGRCALQPRPVARRGARPWARGTACRDRSVRTRHVLALPPF